MREPEALLLAERIFQAFGRSVDSKWRDMFDGYGGTHDSYGSESD
jgi:hypothetical protein